MQDYIIIHQIFFSLSQHYFLHQYLYDLDSVHFYIDQSVHRSDCNKIPTLIINKNSDSDYSKKNPKQQYFSKNAKSS